jgi:hypothetical protein
MIVYLVVLLALAVNASLVDVVPGPFSSDKFGQHIAVSGNSMIVSDDGQLWAYKWGFNKWDVLGSLAGHSGELKGIEMQNNETMFAIYQLNATNGLISLWNMNANGQAWDLVASLDTFADTDFGRASAYSEGVLAIAGNQTLYKIDETFTVTGEAVVCQKDPLTLARISQTDYATGCPDIGIAIGGTSPIQGLGMDMMIQMQDYTWGLPGQYLGVVANSTGGSIGVIIDLFGSPGLINFDSVIVQNHSITSGAGYFTDNGDFVVALGYLNESSTGGLQVLSFNGTSNEYTEVMHVGGDKKPASFFGYNVRYSDLGLYVVTAHHENGNQGIVYTYNSGSYELETTSAPTSSPSVSPTSSPSSTPTTTPTESPTRAPVEGSHAPTTSPTDAPSVSPTDAPSVSPTDAPSVSPTDAPSVSPTDAPSVSPTDAPTTAPTYRPTGSPTETADDDFPMVLTVTLSVAGGVALLAAAYIGWGMLSGGSAAGATAVPQAARVYDF